MHCTRNGWSLPWKAENVRKYEIYQGSVRKLSRTQVNRKCNQKNYLGELGKLLGDWFWAMCQDIFSLLSHILIVVTNSYDLCDFFEDNASCLF